jgi:solute carrier family 19 (thiamine transporter), member 2/3
VNLLWQHFLGSYSNPKIVQWSFWWALAMAGFLMVQIYVQLLWQDIDKDREFLFNAGVEAVLTLLGAISAFLAGFLTTKTFQKFDLWILMFCSLLQGIFILISSQTTSIWVAYAMYITFGVLYTFMITIASATVAQHLADDSFALIFGINTLIALIFQSILTVVVISWLELSTRDQFLVYGGYFIALAVIYLIATVVKLVFCRNVDEYSVRD